MVSNLMRTQIPDAIPIPVEVRGTVTHYQSAAGAQATFRPISQPRLRAGVRGELMAVAASELTPGVVELLAACRVVRRPVAVVSNNANQAIAAFLDQHGLSQSSTTSPPASQATPS